MDPQTISFRVEGTPKGQPRPRAFARKFGQVYSARVYDPGTAEGWKSDIAIAAHPFIPAAPIAVPVRVDVVFLFPRPQRLMKKSSPVGRIRHTAKPDRDNLDKCVLDVLTTLGFFEDDALATDGEPLKRYVALGERPGAEITVTTLTECENHQPAIAANVAPEPLFATAN